MKYATFEINTSVGALERVGASIDGGLLDLSAVYCAWLRDTQNTFAWGELAKEIIPN